MNMATTSDLHFPFSPTPQRVLTSSASPSPSTPNPRTFSYPLVLPHRQNPRKRRPHPIRLDSTGHASKPKHGKRPNPDAPKITHPCSECGKKFWSWKALFGHMRCHPERQWRGMNPPSNLRPPFYQSKPWKTTGAAMTEDDYEVALCLLMLASSPGAVVESPCAASNKGTHEFDAFNCDTGLNVDVGRSDHLGSSSRFECSSCRKVFGSHQALGGHRASHKNVKGCFAMTQNNADTNLSHPYNSHRHNSEGGKRIVIDTWEHKNVMFLLGHKRGGFGLSKFSCYQALVEQKRRHWEHGEVSSYTRMFNYSSATNTSSELDLNVPTSTEDEISSRCSSALPLDLRLGL